MAQLTDGQRRAIWRDYMRVSSDAREPLALTKQELRVAIDATDAFIDGLATPFNNALPAPARAALTPKQKVRVFMAVAKARFGAA